MRTRWCQFLAPEHSHSLYVPRRPSDFWSNRPLSLLARQAPVLVSLLFLCLLMHIIDDRYPVYLRRAVFYAATAASTHRRAKDFRIIHHLVIDAMLKTRNS